MTDRLPNFKEQREICKSQEAVMQIVFDSWQLQNKKSFLVWVET